MANETKLSNLIDPQVLADMVRQKLTDDIKFSPLARVDAGFEGRPGDTVTVPCYTYIGDAEDVAEGAAIQFAELSASSAQVKVKKAGKGVKLTDEALLSGYGDPLGEAARQLSLAIASKVDNDCLTALSGIASSKTYDGSGAVLSSDAVAKALVLFGEDQGGEKVLFVAPEQLAQLRQDSDFINSSELSTRMLMKGTVGSLWGCQLVVSNKIKANSGVYTNYIVKPGALAIFLKRDLLVETDRDIEYKLTRITADEHYVVYLLDAARALKLKVKA